MKYHSIKKGLFLNRANRFIASVIVDGTCETVHVKNTGRCRELLVKGATVYLEDHTQHLGNRKTKYSLVAVEKESLQYGKKKRTLINMDSQAPNFVTLEALKEGVLTLPGMSAPFSVTAEKKYGNSRIDFYIEEERLSEHKPKGKKAFLEVKGCTLEEAGIASFPDAPTERGVKHIKELQEALKAGFSAYLLFVIQMKGVRFLQPNDVTHAAFGEELRRAAAAGVNVLAFDCAVTEDEIKLSEPVEVRI